ncbi:DUF3180 family protein [Microbacterium sp.]|uniref:DUF3180 family protein n=1 Tax=Microbacterium sp. TaxID=51671 RepID=UPI00373630DF
MSRDPVEPVHPDAPDPSGPSGRLRTTGSGTVVGVALVGMVLGWSVRPAAIALDLTAPRAGWVQAGALWVAGAFLLWVARVTARVVRREGRWAEVDLLPHQAVNRLLLAKAGALAGAFFAGAYLGHALSWVGVGREPLGSAVWLSLLAAAGAALVVTGSLLLERACRTPGDDPEP